MAQGEGGGRPTKYTEALEKEICKYIRAGSNYRDAYMRAGICKDTFIEWRDKFPDFSDAIALAEAEWKNALVRKIEAAGVRVVKGKKGEVEVKGDWRANLALLERRFKDEYSLKTLHDVTHSIDQGVENALQLVAAILAGAKTGKRKTKRRP